MYSFSCDYLEGCHEEVLKALCETNMEQAPGYGSDRFTKEAVREIRQACGDDDAKIHFVNGGTQTNQLIIDTMLDSCEGVLAADTGHVNVHEAGAIEFSGHKVLTLPAHDGKVAAADVQTYVERFYNDGNHEHMVFPGMVYISHPSEYGTLYTARELEDLSEVCRRNHLKLFLDGARLGYGLAAEGTDVTLPLIDELCDVFYIGGTKVGALNGEAIVFPGGKEPAHFLTKIKQHGALFAKGRLLGVQFAALFRDELYFRISRHAIEMAAQIRKIFEDAGCRFFIDSPTNQQFIILKNDDMEKLSKYVGFGFWEKYDETHTVVRFASSWATTEEGVEELRQAVSLCFSGEEQAPRKETKGGTIMTDQMEVKLVKALPSEVSEAMDMINSAKRLLASEGVDQWQNGYPDEARIRQDLAEGTGYFVEAEGKKLGYLCADFNGEPAYDHLKGEWASDDPYVVVHRMAFSDEARGRGLSEKAFSLVEDLAESRGVHYFRVDTDEDNERMRHILGKYGFTYRGTIWFDNSVKIAFEKKIR